MEVLVSLVLLVLFATLVFGMLQTMNLQMFRGHEQVEMGHAIQTAVEHFKARTRAAGSPPEGHCPEGVSGRYCYLGATNYWAVYNWQQHDAEVAGLFSVDVTVHEAAGGVPGRDIGSFTFLVFEGGF